VKSVRSFASRKTPSRRRGQVLVEFALVLPFLVLILTAIVDFGFYLYDFIGTNAGVRAGAMAAMAARDDGTPLFTDSEIRAFIREGHGPLNPIEDGGIKIAAKPADPSYNGQLTSVTIEVQHPHEFILPVFIMNDQPMIMIRSRLETVRVSGMAP